MKIKSIRKAVLLLALLTSTSFAAGKNVNVEFRKAIAALSTPAK
ncbi:protein YcgK [Escherichia coli]|nr:protein YcgK [Escherichia coli]